ncbi:DUF935 family protein [bacterium]|nr:DUF935 family protein [bacterium]MBP5435967.1 DUF935 family protein [bacterium]
MQKLLGKTVAGRMTAFDVISFLTVLPNPDPILEKLGRRISTYDTLLFDSQVGSCMASRKAGVSKLNFELAAGNASENVVKFIKEIFDEFDHKHLFDMILNCTAYGYQPIEINWGVRSGKIVPVLIEEKPAEWFCFSEENELRFLSKKEPWAGEALPPMKFICPTLQGSYKNPYGISVLSKCFWPVAFKKGGMKFWVAFTEKYGSPWLIGKYAPGASIKDQNDIQSHLEDMIQDAVGTFPDNSKIEIIEATGKSASAEIFNRLIDVCNADISKAILGQTLTTELGSTGSLAAAQTHNEVRKDIILDDARIIEKAVNQIIRWTVDQNFGTSVPAPKYHFYEPEDVDRQLAERDATLFGIGVRFSPYYIQKTYNIDLKDFKIVDPGSAPLFSDRDNELKALNDFAHFGSRLSPFEQGFISALVRGDFSENHGGGIRDLLDKAASRAFPPELQQKIMEGILKPVFDLIEKGESLEEIQEKLAELLPELNTDELAEVLERACAAADMYGNSGGKV